MYDANKALVDLVTLPYFLSELVHIFLDVLFSKDVLTTLVVFIEPIKKDSAVTMVDILNVILVTALIKMTQPIHFIQLNSREK